MSFGHVIKIFFTQTHEHSNNYKKSISMLERRHFCSNLHIISGQHDYSDYQTTQITRRLIVIIISSEEY